MDHLLRWGGRAGVNNCSIGNPDRHRKTPAGYSCSPMQPTLAVLDLAGTTLAATDDVGLVLRETLASAGLAAPPEAVAALRGRNKRDALRDLLAGAAPGVVVPEERVERLHAEFRRRLLAHAAARPVVPLPGAEAAMRWLRARGVSVALTTGFDRELARGLLEPLGWAPPLLCGVACADDVARGRPAPDLIHHAMRLAGVTDPAAVLVAGDTVADVEAGRAAGTGHIVAVLSGAGTRTGLAAARPTVILESLAALPQWWAARWPAGPER
jgi:phosphonatase-like hydrolase